MAESTDKFTIYSETRIGQYRLVFFVCVLSVCVFSVCFSVCFLCVFFIKLKRYIDVFKKMCFGDSFPIFMLYCVCIHVSDCCYCSVVFLRVLFVCCYLFVSVCWFRVFVVVLFCFCVFV